MIVGWCCLCDECICIRFLIVVVVLLLLSVVFFFFVCGAFVMLRVWCVVVHVGLFDVCAL